MTAMKVRSLIDDKRKQRIRDAREKGDCSIFRNRKKAEPERVPAKLAKKQLNPEEQLALDAELLHELEFRPSFEKVKALLEKGANPNARNGSNEPALIDAVRSYEYTISHAIFVPKGETAEHIREMQHDEGVKILELLLAAGTDVNAQTGSGHTAWDYARDCREQIRPLFEKYGATHMK